jgi:hypothetical protein
MTTVVAALALMTTLASGPRGLGATFAVGRENAAAAQATGPSDADAIRQRVKEGQKVRVTDDQGREWQGRIEGFAPDALVLLTKDRQRRNLPYPSILRIDRPHDTLANGARIGFATGAVFGMLTVIAEANADCEPEAFFSCSDPTAAAYLLVPAIVGGAGAGIGIGIDALVRRDPALFRRGESRLMLAPSLGHGVRGVRLLVRW